MILANGRLRSLCPAFVSWNLKIRLGIGEDAVDVKKPEGDFPVVSAFHFFVIRRS